MPVTMRLSVVKLIHPITVTWTYITARPGTIASDEKKQKDSEISPNDTTVCITSASTTENPTKSSGLKNILHGNVIRTRTFDALLD